MHCVNTHHPFNVRIQEAGPKGRMDIITTGYKMNNCIVCEIFYVAQIRIGISMKNEEEVQFVKLRVVEISEYYLLNKQRE